jgi:4-methyl-5(b-hydroxyethyl)-thiazole monophosphate biosynthesis
MPTVLAILAEGFEEIEAITPIDLLRRAGVGVTIAALAEAIPVAGRNGMTLHADTLLTQLYRGDAAAPPRYDALLLPGGPGVQHLRASARVLQLVRAQQAEGRWLAAICAAPTVLHDAGVLSGRRYTAHFAVAHELPHLLADQRVVRDGNILTSRGAGTALDFGLALVACLVGQDQADKVAHSICA